MLLDLSRRLEALFEVIIAPRFTQNFKPLGWQQMFGFDNFEIAADSRL